MTKALVAGTPWRVILLFAVPLLVGNLVQQLYQVADAIVVGRELGVNALAAVGSTGSMLFLLLGFAWGTTNGFAIPTAQAFGAGDAEAVRRSVAAGALLTAGMSVTLTIAAPLLARPMLELLQTPAELLEDATTFAVISFLGGSTMMFFNFLSAIIRALGDSRTPLKFLVLSSIVNIALVLLLVAGLGLGVGGAALATVLAQLASVLLCLRYVARHIPQLHVRREDWHVSRAELGHHLGIGIPMGFQASIIAIGTLAVQVRLNTLGAEAVAAYTTATRVDGLAIAFLASLGLAVSTFVAQNYGAGEIERIRTGTRQGIVMSLAGAGLLALVLVTAGNDIVRLFVGAGADDVIGMAHWFLVVNGSLYGVLGVLFVTRGALQGLGRTLVPTVSGALELIMRAGAAVVLGGVFGFTGIVWANPLAWIAAAVLLVPAWVSARRSLEAGDASRPGHHDDCSTPSDAVAGLEEGASEGAPVLMGVSGSDRNTAMALVSGAAAELAVEEPVVPAAVSTAGKRAPEECCDSAR